MVALLNQPTAERRAATGAGRAAIVAGVRTPLAKAGTAFRNVHVTDLARRASRKCSTAATSAPTAWMKSSSATS